MTNQRNDAKYVEKALLLASKSHWGQVDKTGHPFILHPLRVASYLGPHESEELIAAALLHDVVEDTPITLDYLEGQFTEFTIAMVDAMTRREDETYKQYIHRVGSIPPAIPLKLADLRDNMDPRRAVTPEIRALIRKRYVWSKEYLTRQLEIFNLQGSL